MVRVPDIPDRARGQRYIGRDERVEDMTPQLSITEMNGDGMDGGDITPPETPRTPTTPSIGERDARAHNTHTVSCTDPSNLDRPVVDATGVRGSICHPSSRPLFRRGAPTSPCATTPVYR